MTRALGDFYAHQFGLTWIPSITTRRIAAGVDYSILLASDGIWDCWKYQDYQDFTNGLGAKGKDITQVCDIILDESIQRAITNFGAKHFDDASLVTISLPGSVPSKGEKEKADKAEKPSEAAKS
jgi:serine/threonine protein phosphatase PrpC